MQAIADVLTQRNVTGSWMEGVGIAVNWPEARVGRRPASLAGLCIVLRTGRDKDGLRECPESPHCGPATATRQDPLLRRSGAPAHHHASTRPAIMARSGEVSRCADPRCRSSGPRFSRSLTSNMHSLTLSLKETFLDAED